jgi:hypothetical protein
MCLHIGWISLMVSRLSQETICIERWGMTCLRSWPPGRSKTARSHASEHTSLHVFVRENYVCGSLRFQICPPHRDRLQVLIVIRRQRRDYQSSIVTHPLSCPIPRTQLTWPGLPVVVEWTGHHCGLHCGHVWHNCLKRTPGKSYCAQWTTVPKTVWARFLYRCIVVYRWCKNRQ